VSVWVEEIIGVAIIRFEWALDISDGRESNGRTSMIGCVEVRHLHHMERAGYFVWGTAACPSRKAGE
jgi:hypothetical protein